MKAKFFIAALTALLFNALTSGFLAEAVGISHGAMFAVQMCLSLIPVNLSGCLAEGLNKEIWLPEIIEKFYPETSFTAEAKNFDPWVDGEYLNVQEAGVDPRVFIDNEIYPIPIVARTDKPYKIPMKRFDTENTVHINAIEIEESAGKRESVIEGHRNSLQVQFAELAAFNYGPTKDDSFTPVVEAKGAASAQDNGYKRMTYADILKLETLFNLLKVPREGRILLLHPYHATDLQLQDIEMFKSFFSTNQLFNFKIYVSGMTPGYNSSTGRKLTWQAPVASTDAIASIAYHKNSVCRAKGGVDMYYRMADPEYRGDVIGFNMRGIALPITGKHLGAIFTPKA